MHKTLVSRVTTFALPGHDRIILKMVEPATHKCITDLNLMIEKPKGETRVHGLDPEGETAELDSELIEIDAVKAALDDMAPEVGAKIIVEVGIAEGLRNGFVSRFCGGMPICEPDDNAGWIRA